MRRSAGLLVFLLVAVTPHPVAAQEPDPTFSSVLSFLLTNRAVQTDDFVRDAEAAAATRDTVERSLLAELATQPPSLSSAGFTYRFNSALGTVERASASFGSFFTERSLTAGRGHGSIGANFRFAQYSRLDGSDLENGTFLTTANQFLDETQPFDEETLSLDLESRILTFTGSYGVTDHLDVSAAVPLVSMSMSGTRVNTYRGTQTIQASATATTSGLGDIAIRAKYGLLSGHTSGLAVAGELRLPTGREEDLLGAGSTGFALLIIGSTEQGAMGLHGNFSVGGGGFSNEVAYRGAVTYNASDRVTLVGEFLGRRIGDAGRITAVRAPHPSIAGVETIRLLTEDSSLSTGSMVAGAKWNVTGTWILAGHTQFPVTDRGLRSGIVTLIGLDYAFGQ